MIKQNWKTVLFLGGFCLFCCWFFVLRHGVFGAQVDWINQHSVLPDYFRRRFYETGSLLPDFAWNLGGGQNIYNISYYGLFSPVVLLSFLLPFIRMDYYIMGSSIVCYTISVLLFYFFLYRKRFPKGICFGVSLLFALAASLMYHSYNQLMFVNYMPFLCLAFLGTDEFLQKGKRGLLLAGVTGMILTSFYFSIGGMAALCLYALSEYMESSVDFTWAALFKKGICYVGNLLHGVLLSGILLLPTAVSIFSSRQGGNTDKKTLEIIAFAPLKILYSPYGMGLSVLAVVAVFGGIFCVAKWQERILPVSMVVMLGVPVIGSLLNGGLYDKGKVFIPFIPVICFLCAKFLMKNLQESWTFWRILPWGITLLAFLWADYSKSFAEYRPLVWGDFGLLSLCFIVPYLLWGIYQIKWRKEKSTAREEKLWKVTEAGTYLMLVFSVACLFLFASWMNPSMERMISGEEYQAMTEKNKAQGSQIKTCLEQDFSFYRMERYEDGVTNHNNINRLEDIHQNITSLYSSCYNMNYMEFRRSVFALNEPFRNNMMQSVTNNPCFLQFMGVKYFLTEEQTAGYTATETKDLWKNEMTAPIFYVTSQVIGENAYRNYSFPDNQTVLLKNAVVPETEKVSQDAAPEEYQGMTGCSFDLPEQGTADLKITKTDYGYEIEAAEEIEVQANITRTLQSAQDDLFALSFDVENLKPGQDMTIRVKGQANRLTSVYHEYANNNTDFTFLTTVEEREESIPVSLGAGHYRIRNVQAFTGNWDSLQNQELYQSPVEFAADDVKGDRIQGKVNAKESGYLISSIPYDENFTICLDGKEIPLLKVNTAFLGAKVEKGEHVIEISYQAPGKFAGLLCSIWGIFLLLLPLFLHKKSK